MAARTNGRVTNNAKDYGGFVDPVLINQTMDTFMSTLSRQFMSQALDPRRDIYQDCGWPPLGDTILANTYRDLYERNSYANRVVELMPKECWQGQPAIIEDESAEELTDFEEAWYNLGTDITPNGHSYYKDEEGSPIWAYLQRLDILSGIGQFGVLLLGLDDGKNLQDPCQGVEVVTNTRRGKRRFFDSPMSENERKLREDDIEEKRLHPSWLTDESTRVWNAAGVRNEGAPGDGPFVQGTDRQYSWQQGLNQPQPDGMELSGTDQQYFGVQFGPSERMGDKPPKDERKLLFLRPFDESLVQVVRYEWNIRNPRFGLPVMYRVTLNDPRQPSSGVGLPLATVYVHWSRVIHVCDNPVVSELFGQPRMKPVLNNLLDITKVLGGDAEGFWRAATPIISLETHPQLGGDVLIDKPELQDTMFKIFNSLQRYMVTSGMAAKTIAPAVSDCTPHVDKQVEAICVKLGCPVRVFKGAERGELASSQDDESWNERKQERQNIFITPKIIVPFIDRLIQIGVLPEPEDGYSVKWPDMDVLGDKDKAAIGLQKTQALAAYVSGGCEAVVNPEDYMTDFLNMEEQRVGEIIDEASKAQEDNMTMPAAGELGHPATAKPPPAPPVLPGAAPGGGAPGGGKPPAGPAAPQGNKPPTIPPA